MPTSINPTGCSTLVQLVAQLDRLPSTQVTSHVPSSNAALAPWTQLLYPELLCQAFVHGRMLPSWDPMPLNRLQLSLSLILRRQSRPSDFFRPGFEHFIRCAARWSWFFCGSSSFSSSHNVWCTPSLHWFFFWAPPDDPDSSTAPPAPHHLMMYDVRLRPTGSSFGSVSYSCTLSVFTPISYRSGQIYWLIFPQAYTLLPESWTDHLGDKFEEGNNVGDRLPSAPA